MIKSERGMVTINGTPIVLEADLQCIVNALIQTYVPIIGEEETKKMIERAVDDGFKDPEEVFKEKNDSLELLKEVLGDLAKLFEK